MHIGFDNKTVLITGAAQGIGRAIAGAFSEAGASLVLTDIDEEGLAGTAGQLDASAYALDLADRSAVHKFVGSLEDGPDILVHAAGGTRGQAGRPIEDIGEVDWHSIFAANVDGFFWLAQACAPIMKSNGSGRMVAIASGAGLRPSLTGIQAYAGAKHALVGIVRQLSWELGPDGITVNSVAPGFVRSNPTTERQWEVMGSDGQQLLLNSIHTRKLGTADDIATATLFLASEQAGWISGQVLSVDGGRS